MDQNRRISLFFSPRRARESERRKEREKRRKKKKESSGGTRSLSLGSNLRLRELDDGRRGLAELRDRRPLRADQLRAGRAVDAPLPSAAASLGSPTPSHQSLGILGDVV